jgi:P4 family phage/plasmid primase-like protien
MENINNINGIGSIEPHNAFESYNQDSTLNNEIKKIYKNNTTKFSKPPSLKTLFSIPQPLNNFYDLHGEITNDIILLDIEENYLQSKDDGYSEQRIEQLKEIVDFFKQYNVINEDKTINIKEFRSVFYNQDLLEAKKFVGWSRKGYKAWKSNNCKNCSFKNGKKCTKFNDSIETINIPFVIAEISCIFKKISCDYLINVIKHRFRPMNVLDDRFIISFDRMGGSKYGDYEFITQKEMERFLKTDYYEKYSSLGEEIISYLFYYLHSNDLAYIMFDGWISIIYPEISLNERKMIISRIRTELRQKYGSVKKEIAYNYPLYKCKNFWDDRFLSEEKYNLRTWGAKNGFLWRRNLKENKEFDLLDWDKYRKISEKEANLLEVLPQEEQMKLAQFVAMKIEDSNHNNLGVAPILFCKFEGVYYERNGLFWKKIEEDGRLIEIVSDKFAELFNGKGSDIAMTRSIIHHYKSRHMIKENEPFNEIAKIKGQIPLKNGVLLLGDNFSVAGFRKYSPRDFFTGCLSSNYDPTAKCPNIEKFLNEILDHKDGNTQKWVDRLLGFTADILLPGNQMEWILYLLGDGRNGKGVYQHILKWLFSPELISSINWSGFDMDNNQFAIYGIFNKWLNICSESNAGKEIKSSLVKNISGNDTIQIRNLYQSPIEYHPLAKLVFMDNISPQIPKTETAIWGRIMTVTFPNNYEGENDDPTLKDIDGKLAQEVKSGGFLNLLLKYLPLEKRKAIKTEALTDSHDLYQDFSERKIAIYQFLDDAVSKSKERTDSVSSEAIWMLYKYWYYNNRKSFPKENKNKVPTRAIGGKIWSYIKTKAKEGYFEKDCKPESINLNNSRVISYLNFDTLFLAELRYKIINELINDSSNWDVYSEILKDEYIPIDMSSKIKSLKAEAEFYTLKRIKQFKATYNNVDVLKIEQIWEKAGEYTKISDMDLGNIILETKEIKDNKEKVIAQLDELHKLYGNEEFFPIEDIFIPISSYFPKINEELLTIILKWFVQNKKVEENNKNEYRLAPKELSREKYKPKEDYEGLLLKL